MDGQIRTCIGVGIRQEIEENIYLSATQSHFLSLDLIMCKCTIIIYIEFVNVSRILNPLTLDLEPPLPGTVWLFSFLKLAHKVLLLRNRPSLLR